MDLATWILKDLTNAKTESVKMRKTPPPKHNSPRYFTPCKTPCKEDFFTPKIDPTTTTKIPKKPQKMESPQYYTPFKSPNKQEDFLKPEARPFKTPLPPKKQLSVTPKFAPSKSQRFKHIQSPVAAYIKGTGEVPMTRNVKVLPGTSIIPKLVKCSAPSKSASKSGNKENENIPTPIFKGAKKKLVIQTSVVKKPESQKDKKLLATLPKPPVILKHEAGESSKARTPLSDMLANVSVCTQVKPSKKQ